MEHTQEGETLAVLRRFLRRYWRIPAQVAGVLGMLLVLLLALPLLPSFNGRIEASSDVAALTGEGAVESLLSKGVGSPFAAPVAEVKVREGQPVRKGDLLFRMDVSELKSQIQAAQSEIAAARANVSAAYALRRDHVAPLAARVRQLRKQLAAENTVTVVPAESAILEEDGENPRILVQPVTVAPDPARLAELQTAITLTEAQMSEEARQWSPVVQKAQQQLAAAQERLSQIRSTMAQAERRSPMDGVVTKVSARQGQWLPVGEPAARVDDPQGYRVVVLVDRATRESVTTGTTMPISVSGTPDRGKLEKVVAGWDKALYSYWLWIKPVHPERLGPGQAVTVVFAPGARVASNQ